MGLLQHKTDKAQMSVADLPHVALGSTRFVANHREQLAHELWVSLQAADDNFFAGFGVKSTPS